MALHRGGKRPPNPDPGNYVWIDTKKGGYWRQKRGTVKPAKVNIVLEQGNNYMKITAPAAARIRKKLMPFMHGLESGRLNVCISTLLMKALKETGKVDLGYLYDLDLQPDHPMVNLLQSNVQVKQTIHELIVKIEIDRYTVKRLNKIVTNYYFELVLLYGDATKENGLRTESEDSDVYDIKKDYGSDCRLSAVLPESPWIALLKVNCIEGNEPAVHPRHYEMKVMARYRDLDTEN
jgi:hypothetical protein